VTLRYSCTRVINIESGAFPSHPLQLNCAYRLMRQAACKPLFFSLASRPLSLSLSLSLSLFLSLSGCSRATAIHSALDALVPYSDVSRRAPNTPPYRADTQYRGRSRLVTLESRGKWDFYKGVAEGEAVQSRAWARTRYLRSRSRSSLPFSLSLSVCHSRARARARTPIN